MKTRWLVLAAFMFVFCGGAFADDDIHHHRHDGVVYVSPLNVSVDRDRLWNPFLGTRPWLEPLGYRIGPARVVTDSHATLLKDGTTVPTTVQPRWEHCDGAHHGRVVGHAHGPHFHL